MTDDRRLIEDFLPIQDRALHTRLPTAVRQVLPKRPRHDRAKEHERRNHMGRQANEVAYWGEWVLKKIKGEIGDLYPLIPDPESPAKDLVPDIQPSLFTEEAGQQKLNFKLIRKNDAARSKTKLQKSFRN